MTIPKKEGDNPEDVTITKDQWVKIFSSVNLGKVTNLFSATNTMWLTYVRTGSNVPVGLNLAKWKVPADTATFKNGVARCDVYAYAVGEDLSIRVES